MKLLSGNFLKYLRNNFICLRNLHILILPWLLFTNFKQIVNGDCRLCLKRSEIQILIYAKSQSNPLWFGKRDDSMTKDHFFNENAA